jgi:sec-independent protein translocase protein TatB
LGIGEIILLAIIALIVLGPEKLPEVVVVVGRVMRELRAASNAVLREIHADFEPAPPALMRRDDPTNLRAADPGDPKTGESAPPSNQA